MGLIAYWFAKSWRDNERIDLDHYIEVRHAFDSARRELKMEEVYVHSRESEAEFYTVNPRSLWTSVRHPYKFYRYKQLLHVVRLHELRSNFLSGNSLPYDFQVHRYLDRCLTNLLVGMVEISFRTWAFLLVMLELYFYLSTIEAFT
jgi:hypothetical protein